MIAIIPARKGSKGLPNKNIKVLLGKPLIAYTIEAALEASQISEVYVSTDDQETADIAIKYGAKAPFLRPSELATDTSLAIDVYLYMIDKLEAMNCMVEAFVVLQPTSPLRSAIDIDQAITLFNEKKADSVVSYVKESHPISWHKFIDENLHITPIFEEIINNRQDHLTSYYPNGAIYVFRTVIIKERKYYTTNSFAYIMSKQKSVDIDYLEDFDYVEFLMKKDGNNG